MPPRKYVRKSLTRRAPRWVGRLLSGLAAVALLGFAVWAVIRLPGLQLEQVSDPTEAQILNDYRRTILQGVAGVAVAIGFYLTYRRIRASEEANRLTETSQVTERFTRAIEQLGNDDLSIRLGGIYSLERIARDSEDDHWTVMEVLSAFLRENATEQENAALPSANPDAPSRYAVRTDLQAALSVIGRRTERSETDPLDLGGVWIRSYSLRYHKLQRAILRGAHLEGANLFQAHLEGADLFQAHLERAYLGGAHFESSSYQFSRGTPASIRQATIDGIRYQHGMPDPREQWPPPANWRDLAAQKKATPPASVPPPADRGGKDETAG